MSNQREHTPEEVNTDICPIMSGGIVEVKDECGPNFETNYVNCERMKCAWFVSDHNHCAVWIIAADRRGRND